MQRQLDEFNRSVTIIIWYKVSLMNILNSENFSLFALKKEISTKHLWLTCFSGTYRLTPTQYDYNKYFLPFPIFNYRGLALLSQI